MACVRRTRTRTRIGRTQWENASCMHKEAMGLMPRSGESRGKKEKKKIIISNNNLSYQVLVQFILYKTRLL